MTKQLQRSFRSALAPENLKTIQEGSHRYSWKGVPMWKNPFDFAIYWLLVWHARPHTIIEIGSKYGGSALWFADMLQIYGIEGRKVVSVDINLVTSIQDSRIDFICGDAGNLAASLTPGYLATLPRPWLVIDDASHVYEHCLATIEFFHTHLRKGDFLAVEDGIVDDLGASAEFNGGPNRAVKEFMLNHGQDYAMAIDLCDFWGHNITWNPNGYWKRVA